MKRIFTFSIVFAAFLMSCDMTDLNIEDPPAPADNNPRSFTVTASSREMGMSNIEGAQVFVADSLVGETPLAFSLAPRKRQGTLMAWKAGFYSKEEYVALNLPGRYNFDLTPTFDFERFLDSVEVRVSKFPPLAVSSLELLPCVTLPCTATFTDKSVDPDGSVVRGFLLLPSGGEREVSPGSSQEVVLSREGWHELRYYVVDNDGLYSSLNIHTVEVDFSLLDQDIIDILLDFRSEFNDFRSETNQAFTELNRRVEKVENTIITYADSILALSYNPYVVPTVLTKHPNGAPKTTFDAFGEVIRIRVTAAHPVGVGIDSTVASLAGETYFSREGAPLVADFALHNQLNQIEVYSVDVNGNRSAVRSILANVRLVETYIDSITVLVPEIHIDTVTVTDVRIDTVLVTETVVDTFEVEGQIPVAIITVSDSDGLIQEGERVCFDGKRSFHPDSKRRIVSYEWYLAEAGQQGGQEVCANFNEGGVKSIFLVVTDDKGRKSVPAHTDVVVLERPVETECVACLHAVRIDPAGDIVVRADKGEEGKVAQLTPLPIELLPAGVEKVDEDGEAYVLLLYSGDLQLNENSLIMFEGGGQRFFTKVIEDADQSGSGSHSQPNTVLVSIPTANIVPGQTYMVYLVHATWGELPKPEVWTGETPESVHLDMMTLYIPFCLRL